MILCATVAKLVLNLEYQKICKCFFDNSLI